MERKILKGLTAQTFTSDADHWALDKLQKIPLLPMLVEKFFEMGLDRWLYCMNMSMSVRCGPNQYPTLYNIMKESSDVLDMPMPDLYVTNSPWSNAYTSGVGRPYIMVHSSIVDNLTDEELYHLMGHELGHIKADHVLYMTVMRVLYPLLNAIGRSTFGLGDVATVGLVLAIYEWYRQAEISADRAGLLVTQSLDVSIDAEVALTAGPNRLRHEMSRDAFMDQCRAYQDMGPWDQLGKVIVFILMSSTFTHPMPVHRTQKLVQWYESGDYDRILAGEVDRSRVKAS